MCRCGGGRGGAEWISVWAGPQAGKGGTTVKWVRPQLAASKGDFNAVKGRNDRALNVGCCAFERGYNRVDLTVSEDTRQKMVG